MSGTTMFEFPYTCISKQEYKWLVFSQNALGFIGLIVAYSLYEYRRENKLEARRQAERQVERQALKDAGGT